MLLSSDICFLALAFASVVVIYLSWPRARSLEIKYQPSQVSDSLDAIVQQSPQLVVADSAVQPIAEINWLQRLGNGLARTRSQLSASLDELFMSADSKATREQIFENLFEMLIRADVGVSTSEMLVDRVKKQLSSAESVQLTHVKTTLQNEITSLLNSIPTISSGTLESPRAKPHVVMMVGVNGVGKTTTTGKLAYKMHQKGLPSVIGAADTFRAAAVEQLKIWAERSSATFVQLKDGADPASVAFETVRIAKSQDAAVCLIDTAGRLHNRQDLMQELSKIKRVMAKECDSAPHEVLLVLDATTGQNGIQQARIFREVVDITGIVLTKLDGSAKGGVVLAIANELKLPIRYIGVGEQVEDLEVFNASEFVAALFS